eukprot:TRINITY_DN3814_c0_g4_i2.p1 TRINITY_DN3814_c0_g4~~TRINITY_DN3814_c0_g4_i2.p1  ORF type:complete len:185 (-),score=66.80 TRINITY_DN3814_c0_g4_i2:48-602(-)
MGVEQSRRDDLECLGYVMVYFLKGQLPWQGLKAKDRKDKYEKIKAKKQMISIEKLCEGLPQEFVLYLKHCRSLNFEQTPNYFYLKSLFENLFEQKKYIADFAYDWIEVMDTKKTTNNEAIKLMLEARDKNETKESSKYDLMPAQDSGKKLQDKEVPACSNKNHAVRPHQLAGDVMELQEDLVFE